MYRNNQIESCEGARQDRNDGNLTINQIAFWVKLAREIPWNLLEDQFATVDPAEQTDESETQEIRMLLGAMIIRKVYNLDPDATIALIKKNPYLQYFIGLKEYSATLSLNAAMISEFQTCIPETTLVEIAEFIERIDLEKPIAPETSTQTCSQNKLIDSNENESVAPNELVELNENNAGNVVETNIDPLERTMEMPVLLELPSSKKTISQMLRRWYFRSIDCGQNCYLRTIDYLANCGDFISHWLQCLKSKIGPWRMQSYEARPQIKAALAILKKWGVQFLAVIRQGLLYLRVLNKGWLKVILSIMITIFGILVAVIIWLPVPAPRMLVASEIYDINHKLAATFFSENRRPVKLKEVPDFLRNAVLAVEDHRFYKHQGINPGRIIKAAINDIGQGKLEQGGSTITQQLVKNVYLTRERTFSRKFQELLYSIKLEYKLTKDQIFELYLNKIYFGHGAYGVKVAAETYFQKELSQLNQAEMALIAGLPRGPAFYSPYKHPKAARERLLQTLLRMKECGYITAEQYQTYSKQTLHLPGIKTKNNVAPYFMDLLQREITRIFPNNPELIYTSGLKIESTLDLELQKAASKAFRNRIPVIYRPKGGLPQPQGALIAINPKNGEIRALIGGTDYTKSQFNRAIQAKRQPGSAFKPILYTAAFSKGFTLNSRIDRSPKTYYLSGQTYCPTDKHSGSGTISLRNALAQSSNVVAVKLMERIGFKPVLNLADQLGIKSKLRPTLSLALGACEVTPLELTTAYATLANGGIRNTPITIRRILNTQGRVLYQAKTKGVAVVNSSFAFLTTQAMREVLRSGTAAKIGRKFKCPIAGKTGTTNNNRDTWFLGYTPDLVACVFVGCDKYERTLPGMASQVAAPIWADFMLEALKNKPVRDFSVPENIKKIAVCPITGKLADKSCPSYWEYFLKGTEPVARCAGHYVSPTLGPPLNGKSANQSQSKPIEKDNFKTTPNEKRKEGRKIPNFLQRIWNKIK
jgi:1A family penicillin-binding protein